MESVISFFALVSWGAVSLSDLQMPKAMARKADNVEGAEAVASTSQRKVCDLAGVPKANPCLDEQSFAVTRVF